MAIMAGAKIHMQAGFILQPALWAILLHCFMPLSSWPPCPTTLAQILPESIQYVLVPHLGSEDANGEIQAG